MNSSTLLTVALIAGAVYLLTRQDAVPTPVGVLQGGGGVQGPSGSYTGTLTNTPTPNDGTEHIIPIGTQPGPTGWKV